jgi:hypothetical protein
MLATGIMLKKGDQITISLRHLEVLRTALPENMTIHITRAFIQNKNHYFLSVDHPDHSSPAKQVRANPRIIIRRGGTQLDHRSTLLLNHLLAEIVDEEEVAEEDEPQVDCQIIPVDNNVDNEPMLVDEEVQQVEEEDEEEQLQPYQLTNFYQQQRLCFEEQFNTWFRQCKEEQLMLFEQQQQQHYVGALLVAEHEQQRLPIGENGDHEMNEGNEVIDDDEANNNLHDAVGVREAEQEVIEEDNNNNIIINNDDDDGNNDDEEMNNNIIINFVDEDVVDDEDENDNNIIMDVADDVFEDDNIIIINAVDDDRDGNENFIEQYEEQQLANGHVPLQHQPQVVDNKPIMEDIVEQEEVGEEDEEDEIEYLTREEKQEQLVEESLDLPVVETAVMQQHPERNGEGNIELHKQKQFNNHERAPGL